MNQTPESKCCEKCKVIKGAYEFCVWAKCPCHSKPSKDKVKAMIDQLTGWQLQDEPSKECDSGECREVAKLCAERGIAYQGCGRTKASVEATPPQPPAPKPSKGEPEDGPTVTTLPNGADVIGNMCSDSSCHCHKVQASEGEVGVKRLNLAELTGGRVITPPEGVMHTVTRADIVNPIMRPAPKPFKEGHTEDGWENDQDWKEVMKRVSAVESVAMYLGALEYLGPTLHQVVSRLLASQEARLRSELENNK